MCSALGNGGARRAQQLWPKWRSWKERTGGGGVQMGRGWCCSSPGWTCLRGKKVLCFPPHSARAVQAQQWGPSCDWNKLLLGGCLLGDGRIWVDVWVKDRNKTGRVGKRKIWLMGCVWEACEMSCRAQEYILTKGEWSAVSHCPAKGHCALQSSKGIVHFSPVSCTASAPSFQGKPERCLPPWFFSQQGLAVTHWPLGGWRKSTSCALTSFSFSFLPGLK